MASNPLIKKMAENAGVTDAQYYNTLMATVMPARATNEQFLAFLQVAARYELDPLTKEIYAFPTKAGGIQPVVGVDGWMRLANRNPKFDGLEHEDIINDKGELVAVTCRVYRKDRAHPVTATEYMAECKRDTEPWGKWPRRMLRHKSTIQALRYAFGFAGIVDPDEAERYYEATAEDVTEAQNATRAATDDLKEKIAAARGAGGRQQASADPSRAAAPSPHASDGPTDDGADVGLSLGMDDVTYGEEEGAS